jgi:hypothetical protein
MVTGCSTQEGQSAAALEPTPVVTNPVLDSTTSPPTEPVTTPPTATEPIATEPVSTLPVAAEPTTTVAVDEQPRTASEGRALLELSTETPATELTKQMSDSVRAALTDVVSGRVVPADFFAVVTSSVPTQMVGSFYLICDPAKYPGRGCGATRADFQEHADRCVSKAAEVVETIVEDTAGWAISTACLWHPTMDEIAAAQVLVANKLHAELTADGLDVSEDQSLAELSQVIADTFGNVDNGTLKDPRGADGKAAAALFQSTFVDVTGLCGSVHLYGSVDSSKPLGFEILENGWAQFLGSIAQYGTAVTVRNGQFLVEYCIRLTMP